MSNSGPRLEQLEAAASTNDAWQVAFWAEILAANSGLRGGEIKQLRLGMVDLAKRRLRVSRQTTKTNAGARLIELNIAATDAVGKLYERAKSLGACDPSHYLLPADLSRHTKNGDPLKGRQGFDPTRHQISWRTSWCNLRKAAGDQIVASAERENRELTIEDQEAIGAFHNLRFHDLRHHFISQMGERGVPLQVVQSMVGHMSARMIRHYTHISNNAVRDAVELLDQERTKKLPDTFVGKPVRTLSHPA